MKRNHPTAPRRAWKVVLGLVVLACVLIAGAVLLKPAWVGERLRGQVETAASRALGHRVTVEKLSPRWFPTPGVTLTNLRAQGLENEPPLLEVSRATATVQLWPLVRSLGKEVRVGSVTLDGPQVNLVRRADGTWNYQSVGQPPADVPPSQPPAQQSSRQASVERIRLRNGVVNVVDAQAAQGNASVALRDIDLKLEKVGAGLPLEGTLKAAWASSQQNVEADFKVDPLPTHKPQPGQPWPEVTLHFSGKDLSVNALRDFLPATQAQYFTGGVVHVDADVKTQGGRYVLGGNGSAKGLKLRGDPASGSFTFSARIDPEQVKTTQVSFSRLALSGAGVELGGTASVQLRPMRVRFDLQGSDLDLQHLLGEQAPTSRNTEPAPTALPLSLRRSLGKVDVDGTLKFGKVRHGPLTLTQVDAHARLDDGRLHIQQGHAQVYGGQADIAGTQVDLTQAQPTWNLKAKLEGLDTAQAFTALSGSTPLQGKASGQVELSGKGLDWTRIRQEMTGTGSMQLRDGIFTKTDLGATLTPALTQGLLSLGQKGASESVQKAGRGTHFKDLDARFKVQGGWVSFTQPMAFQSDLGDGTVEGRVGLDQRLDLKGTVKASKDFVSDLTRGAVPVSAPVSVPITISGTLKDPKVSAGAPEDIAKGLLPALPVPKSVENPLNQARRSLEGLLRRPTPPKPPPTPRK
ncbi:AsmA family protein [Myxococcus landrumensis]|uniref:AsmA family protein n=1 Tax=Myxococcus landrumensis TaxID=2813577 RepID=A0ABX7NE06_9BACT|nr:AsmA family protein [Myxococcus landrumus]QSQ17040.1 AsmA family protein [Myxococcus landrumus]